VEELPAGTPPHPEEAMINGTMPRIESLQRKRGSTACNSAMLAFESAVLDRVAQFSRRILMTPFVTSGLDRIAKEELVGVPMRVSW